MHPEERLRFVLLICLPFSVFQPTWPDFMRAHSLTPFTFAKAICKGLLGAVAVKHLRDVTLAFAVLANTLWLHVELFAPPDHSARLVPQRRSSDRGLRLVVHDPRGAPVFSRWKVSNTPCAMPIHLRELKALIVIEKEPWATDMKLFAGTPKPWQTPEPNDCTIGGRA